MLPTKWDHARKKHLVYLGRPGGIQRDCVRLRTDWLWQVVYNAGDTKSGDTKGNNPEGL